MAMAMSVAPMMPDREIHRLGQVVGMIGS